MYSIVANSRVRHGPLSFELCVRVSLNLGVGLANNGGRVDLRQKHEVLHQHLVDACIFSGIPPPLFPSYTIL
jgi:hypothetical protein